MYGAILGLAYHCGLDGTRSVHVAVEGVVRDVQRSAHKPLRPFRPARTVEHRLVEREPLDAAFGGELTPKLFRIFAGKSEELRAIAKPEALHESPHVGRLDLRRRGLIDPVRHYILGRAMSKRSDVRV